MCQKFNLRGISALLQVLFIFDVIKRPDHRPYRALVYNSIFQSPSIEEHKTISQLKLTSSELEIQTQVTHTSSELDFNNKTTRMSSARLRNEESFYV